MVQFWDYHRIVTEAGHLSLNIYILWNSIKLWANAEPVSFITDLYILKANDKVVSKIIKRPMDWVDDGWVGGRQQIMISNI